MAGFFAQIDSFLAGKGLFLRERGAVSSCGKAGFLNLAARSVKLTPRCDEDGAIKDGWYTDRLVGRRIYRDIPGGRHTGRDTMVGISLLQHAREAVFQAYSSLPACPGGCFSYKTNSETGD